MRVVGYSRVSTEEQATTGVSLPAQDAKLDGYAKLYDLNLVEVIADEGISAKSLNRPGLQRSLGMLRSGKADGLLVAKLDRLTRSIADWQTLIDGYFCERAGKQLFSVADSIDTRSANGRMVLNVILTISQWEREAIGERTRDALQYKIQQGQRVGRIRYGFDLVHQTKIVKGCEKQVGFLVPNPGEQEVLRLIGQLRADGQSLREIAAELTTRGIPTKDGGHRWGHSAIARIVGRNGNRPGAEIAV